MHDRKNIKFIVRINLVTVTVCQNTRRLVGHKTALQKPFTCENKAFNMLSVMELFKFPPSCNLFTW